MHFALQFVSNDSYNCLAEIYCSVHQINATKWNDKRKMSTHSRRCSMLFFYPVGLYQLFNGHFLFFALNTLFTLLVPTSIGREQGMRKSKHGTSWDTYKTEEAKQGAEIKLCKTIPFHFQLCTLIILFVL